MRESRNEVSPLPVRNLRSDQFLKELHEELSVLPATGRVIPIVYETTFEAILGASPMLHSRSSLSADESILSKIA